MRAPCKGCDRRTPGCHSVCADYRAYSEECAARRENRRLELVNSPETSTTWQKNTWRKAKENR